TGTLIRSLISQCIPNTKFGLFDKGKYSMYLESYSNETYWNNIKNILGKHSAETSPGPCRLNKHNGEYTLIPFADMFKHNDVFTREHIVWAQGGINSNDGESDQWNHSKLFYGDDSTIIKSNIIDPDVKDNKRFYS